MNKVQSAISTIGEDAFGSRHGNGPSQQFSSGGGSDGI